MEGLLQGGGGVQRAEQNAARLSQHLLARVSTVRSPAATNTLSSSPVFEHESAGGHHNRPVSLSRRCTTLMISEESIHYDAEEEKEFGKEREEEEKVERGRPGRSRGEKEFFCIWNAFPQEKFSEII